VAFVTPLPANPVPGLASAPSGLPDRGRSRAVVGSFVVVLLGVMAFRAYSPQLRARPTEVANPPARVVDVNRADRAELLQIPGFGPERADAVLAHRAANGPFGSVNELDAVHGIGGKLVAKVRPFLTVGEAEPVEKLERKQVAPPPAPAAVAGKIKAGDPPIDVNAPSLAELQRLPGIGPVLARKIIDARADKPFAAVEDLRKVSGIGVKTLDKLRPFVTVGAKGK
jgi:competence protein ComEA